jgi:hypothetical protein
MVRSPATKDARHPSDAQMAPAAGDVTQLLADVQNGRRDAAPHLIPLVYEELRRLAHRQMRRERPEQTLQATALVHEAYFRLVNQPERTWQNRTHFVRIADRTKDDGAGQEEQAMDRAVGARVSQVVLTRLAPIPSPIESAESHFLFQREAWVRGMAKNYPTRRRRRSVSAHPRRLETCFRAPCPRSSRASTRRPWRARA